MASVNSTTSANRLTGLATGLDIDSMVKTQMSVYEKKVNSVIQQKDVVEIRQKLYRDILSDTRNFYNKYLDPLSKDSLLLSSAYKSVKFTSSDDSIVSVTSNAEAKVDSYTVTGTKATAAKATLTGKDIENGSKLTINGKEFTLTGETPSERVKNLNNELKSAGFKIEAKYSNFAGSNGVNESGIILESTELGKDTTFTINSEMKNIGVKTEGQEGTKSQITGLTLENIKKGIEIDGKTLVTGIVAGEEDDAIIEKLNLALKEHGFTATLDSTTKDVTLTSIKDGAEDIKISSDGATINFAQGSTETGDSINLGNLGDLKKEKVLQINGNVISFDFDNIDAGKEIDYINEVLKNKGINVKASLKDSSEVILTSEKRKTGDDFEVKKVVDNTVNPIKVMAGTDADIKIINSNGGVYTHKGSTNTVTLDGVTFKINGNIESGKEVKITGKVDVTESKDKIVNFINDYNTLMEKLNKTVNTKHDRDYVPLTSAQKEQMSDKEIELWEAKVENGQLYKDSDITRIMNSMKQTMRTVMSGSGFNLKDMGIIPIEDYSGNKNGTFTIDESKLTEALENNMDDVLNLFTSNPKTTTDTNGTTNKGILYQLKDTLNSEVMKSDSILSKKVGIEGTSTFTNNTLTKNISDYETKIKKMQKDLATREQHLYSKYATLETIMNKYNSQQSYLTSYLGS